MARKTRKSATTTGRVKVGNIRRKAEAVPAKQMKKMKGGVSGGVRVAMGDVNGDGLLAASTYGRGISKPN